MASLHIEGVDEVRRILGDLGARATLRSPMTRSLLRLAGHMGDYSRVLGPPSPRYMRGRGPVNSQGIVNRLTSEHLGKRWTQDVREEGAGLVGVLGNVVSYGPRVHAAEGEPKQAWMHRQRGAKTDARVLEEEQGWIQNEFDAALQRVCDGSRP